MDHIEPRVHDEIKDYREKFYNFTLRQWIFGILIVLTTVPLYLVLSPKIGSDLTGWIVIVIAIPIGFFGFIPVQGLPAEKIIFYWKRNYINFSKPIVYKSEEDLLKEKQNKIIMGIKAKHSSQNQQLFIAALHLEAIFNQAQLYCKGCHNKEGKYCIHPKIYRTR